MANPKHGEPGHSAVEVIVSENGLICWRYCDNCNLKRQFDRVLASRK